MLIVGGHHNKLSAYVVCSGLIYGNGEESLFGLFRQAWMKPEEELPIIGEGNNLIPMIHVQDLAQIVKKVIEVQPVQQYIFAIDYETLNQRKLVTCTYKYN